MKIIKYQKLNKDRYKLYLDNQTTIILEEDVILNNNLLFNHEIDEYTYNKLLKDNKVINIYNSCLKLITIRLRSTYEIRKYLSKKEITKEEEEYIINKLTNIGYLNDKAFIKAFILDKINLTKSGPYKIIKELKEHQIDSELIYQYLNNEEFNNLFNEKLSKLITKSIKANKSYSGNILKQKIYNNLINLGYRKESILEAFSNFNFTNDSKLKEEYNKLYKKYNKKYPSDKLEYIIRNKLLQKGYTIDSINNVNS